MTNWTMPKLKRLKECYPTMTVADLETEFAPHTAAQIRATASAMGLRRRVGRRDWMAIARAHVPVLTFGIARRG